FRSSSFTPGVWSGFSPSAAATEVPAKERATAAAPATSALREKSFIVKSFEEQSVYRRHDINPIFRVLQQNSKLFAKVCHCAHRLTLSEKYCWSGWGLCDYCGQIWGKQKAPLTLCLRSFVYFSCEYIQV